MLLQKRSRNLILDFLRLFATIQIFLMHLTIFLPEVEGNTVFLLMSKLSSRGGNAVAILFCLSGYLIFGEIANGSVDVKQYYKKRIRRIVPVYYVVLFLYIAVGLLPFDLGVLRYFFFLNAVVPSDNYALYNNMGAFWTMGAFMLWYLLAPWLTKYIKNLKTALVFMGVSFVFGQVGQEVLEIIYRGLNANMVDYMVGNNPIGNIWFFAAGVVCYYVIKEQKILQGIFLCMIGITILTAINSPWYPFWMLLAMIFIMLSESVVIELPEGIQKIVIFASNISFDFYLVHLGIIHLLDQAGVCDTYGSLAFVIGACVLTLPVAVFVYYLDVKGLQRLFCK